MFFALSLIFAGFVLLLNHFFGFDISFIKIFFGLFVIFLGFKIIFSTFSLKLKKVSNNNSAIFSKSTFKLKKVNINWSDNNKDPLSKDFEEKDNEYNVVFGESQFDLRSINIEESKSINVHVVFGKMTILIPKDLPIKIKSNVVFGSIKRHPQEENFTSPILGNVFYSYNLDKDKKSLTINTDVVFGEVILKIMD